MVFLVVGNCQESSAGIPACQSASMAIADPLTIAAGPQTGTYRATWFEVVLLIPVRIAEVLFRVLTRRGLPNCSAAIPRRPTIASVMQDPERQAIGTSSEFPVT